MIYLKPKSVLLLTFVVTGCQVPQQDCQLGLDETYSRAVALLTLETVPTSFSLQTNLVGASLNPDNNGLLIVKTSQTAYSNEGCSGKTNSEFLMITTLGESNQPKTLGQIPVSYIEDNQGGFSSLDEITVTPDPNSDYPRFELTQTTLPAEGDAAFRPGPPTSVVYCYRDDQYQTGQMCEQS